MKFFVFQIKFGKWVELSHVATQGVCGVNNFVKSFTLAFSYDGVFYESYKQNGRTKVMCNKYCYT